MFARSVQRIDFLNQLKQMQVAVRSSSSITLRLQKTLLGIFEKYRGGFFEQSKMACEVLSYVLHALQKLCYRDWEEGEDVAGESKGANDLI